MIRLALFIFINLLVVNGCASGFSGGQDVFGEKINLYQKPFAIIDIEVDSENEMLYYIKAEIYDQKWTQSKMSRAVRQDLQKIMQKNNFVGYITLGVYSEFALFGEFMTLEVLFAKTDEENERNNKFYNF